MIYSTFVLGLLFSFVLVLGGDLKFLPILLALGIPLLVVLIKYPEITLMVFLVSGYFKGDPRLMNLFPVDVTIAMALVLFIVILLQLIIHKKRPSIQKEIILYIPFVIMMLVSLSYTPDFGVGLDKASRFVILTGLAIIAPFFILDSAKKMKLFLLSFVIFGFIVALNSLSMLGGGDRFVAPSGLTIQLGFLCSISIAIIWYMILMTNPNWRRRLFGSLLLIIFVITLIGSGARSAFVGILLCILISPAFNKKLVLPVLANSFIILMALSFVQIPTKSYEYIETLTHSTSSLLGFRSELMQLGWDLTMEFPILGIGIGGYPFHSPNPLIFQYPHNVILEVSSEMGIFSAFLVCALIVLSFLEILRLSFNKDLANAALARTVFALIIISVITGMTHGDINSLRIMWFCLSLPFVLRVINKDILKIDGTAVPVIKSHD